MYIYTVITVITRWLRKEENYSAPGYKNLSDLPFFFFKMCGAAVFLFFFPVLSYILQYIILLIHTEPLKLICCPSDQS